MVVGSHNLPGGGGGSLVYNKAICMLFIERFSGQVKSWSQLPNSLPESRLGIRGKKGASGQRSDM